MNRRTLLASLAALPFIGKLFPAKAEGLRIKSLAHSGPVGDGVALNSMAHPYCETRLHHEDIRGNVLEYIEIDLPSHYFKH